MCPITRVRRIVLSDRAYLGMNRPNVGVKRANVDGQASLFIEPREEIPFVGTAQGQVFIADGD